jgi:hypothetical protein
MCWKEQVIVILLTIMIIYVYDKFAGKDNFLLYQPTCQGINPSECTGLTSGNMPAIDSTSYDWFRSKLMCDGSLGVPPSY